MGSRATCTVVRVLAGENPVGRAKPVLFGGLQRAEVPCVRADGLRLDTCLGGAPDLDEPGPAFAPYVGDRGTDLLGRRAGRPRPDRLVCDAQGIGVTEALRAQAGAPRARAPAHGRVAPGPFEVARDQPVEQGVIGRRRATQQSRVRRLPAPSRAVPPVRGPALPGRQGRRPATCPPPRVARRSAGEGERGVRSGGRPRPRPVRSGCGSERPGPCRPRGAGVSSSYPGRACNGAGGVRRPTRSCGCPGRTTRRRRRAGRGPGPRCLWPAPPRRPVVAAGPVPWWRTPPRRCTAAGGPCAAV